MVQQLSTVQVDVFTAQPFEGNALAVVLKGNDLSDAQMQAIAKETNLSETTFILPRDPAIEQDRGVRVRIFTVQEELPFAGHPTLGTAFVLRGSTASTRVRLDLNVGTVTVQFEEKKNEPLFGEMTQNDPKFLARHEHHAVASALGLNESDFDTSRPIETISTGLPFTIAAIRSLEKLRNMRFDPARGAEYLEPTGGKFFYFVSRETTDPSARLHARMFFYNGEDPATGSAAGCAASWMVAHGVAQSDERVLIEQGLEMKRPSEIFVRAAKKDNRVVNVRVGGHAVEVMRGEFSF
jgi:trans-2,3-dihydro-3-hydroxyanthranilate isomerase